MTQPTINTKLIDSLIENILSLSDPEIELFITKLNTAIPTELNQTAQHQALKQATKSGSNNSVAVNIAPTPKIPCPTY
ncbi:MAG: hypothetical protein ACPGVO_09550 [Spirulinaceae cyanobacterium]